jgi:GNAT superfamily N-acetyltransferase
MTEIVVGALEETQIVAAGRILTAAFHDDPLQMYVFPDPAERTQRSPAQFSALVRYGSLFGEVCAAAGMIGVSAWVPPGVTSTAEQASQSGYQQLPRLMGNEAFRRLGMVLDYLSDAHRAGLPGEHWYLAIVGVLPEHQSRGYGEALLTPIIHRADAAGVPICLDSAQPRVASFYAKLGFRPAIETVDPTSGLRFRTYQRDPR